MKELKPNTLGEKPEARKLTRRQFLVRSGLTIAGLAGAGILLESSGNSNPNYKLGVEWDNDHDHLSFEEAAQLSRKMGRAYKALGIEDWKPNFTPEFVVGWLEEAGDQIAAEGLAQEIAFPFSFDVFHPEDGMDANHLLGFTDCYSLLRFNSRMVNPATNWYNSPLLLGTLVHEMVHFEAQGMRVCRENPSPIIETTAQIGMIETLAGMTTRGNKMAFKAFVLEGYDMANAALLAIAVRDNRIEEYKQVRAETQSTPFDMAKIWKMFQDWKGDKATDLKDILLKYNLAPMELITKAYLKNDNKIDGLALAPRPAKSYSELPAPVQVDINDWAYVMDHLESLTNEGKT